VQLVVGTPEQGAPSQVLDGPSDGLRLADQGDDVIDGGAVRAGSQRLGDDT
jgi:hypothetical protein